MVHRLAVAEARSLAESWQVALRAESMCPQTRITIWDEWVDEDGDLGPVHGHQWRFWQAPQALARAADLPGEVVVAGGAQVYADALAVATEQVITEVPMEPEGDVRYPAYGASEWVETARESFEGFERIVLRRRG